MKRKLVTLRLGLLVAGLAVFAAHAAAAIVYVDATHGAGGNTTLVGGAQWDPLTASQGAGGDGVWALRAFGNSATIYQNSPSGSIDNAHRLQTNVSGLALGVYNAYAYFWSDSSSWRMEASLTDNPGGDLPLFSFNPTTAGVVQHYTGADVGGNLPLSTSLGVNPFTTGVMVGDAARRLFQIPLGQVTGTSFPIYIDDDHLQVDQNQRTWYDGVGYELDHLVPEPTSFALLGLGLGVLLVGRRKSRSAT